MFLNLQQVKFKAKIKLKEVFMARDFLKGKVKG